MKNISIEEFIEYIYYKNKNENKKKKKNRIYRKRIKRLF